MADFYRSEGYVVLEKAMSLRRIEKLRSEIGMLLSCEAHRYLPESLEREPQCFDEWLIPLFHLNNGYRTQLYQLLQCAVSLHEIAVSEVLQEIAKNLGCFCPSLRNVALRIDIPHEDRFLQPLHQDMNAMRSENAVNFWIPFQAVTVANGALTLFPQSHKMGPLGYTERDPSGYFVIEENRLRGLDRTHCTISAGDVLVFDPFLVHGSAPNRSDRIRWTAISRYDNALAMNWMIHGENPFQQLHGLKS